MTTEFDRDVTSLRGRLDETRRGLLVTSVAPASEFLDDLTTM